MTSTPAPGVKTVGMEIGWNADGARIISSQLGESAEWLESRLTAVEMLKRTPWPNPTHESWRRTDPRLIGQRLFKLWHPTATRKAVAFSGQDSGSVNLGGSRLSLVNCLPVEQLLTGGHGKSGIAFQPLSAALNNGSRKFVSPELWGLETDADSPALDLALRAFWQGGAYLRVPDGVDAQTPLHLRHHIDTPQTALFVRNVLKVGEAAQVDVLLEQTAVGVEPAWFGGQTLVSIGAGAQLNLIIINRADEAVRFYDHLQIRLERDARLTLTWADLTRGWAVVRRDLTAAGAGAEAHLHGVHIGAADGHLDLRTRQEHPAPATVSELLYKAVLFDQSQSVFQGLIRVEPEAVNANAYQLNRNLLMDAGARADSIPKLEIMVDEVRCTHGASSGKVEPEALFYLMSRGMSRRDATRLMVEGFLKEAGEQIKDAGLHSYWRNQVQARLSEVSAS